jgi:hypothetical protein
LKRRFYEMRFWKPPCGFFRIFFFGMLAGPVAGGMCLLSLRQLAVAARWSLRFVPLLWAVFMQVSAPTSQAVGRLFTVGPDVAKLLAVKTLGEGILGSDANVAEAGEFECFLGLFRPRQGNKE